MLAVGHLHDMKIAHRNLNLDNIIMDRDGFIKVIDYGLAKELKPGE